MSGYGDRGRTPTNTGHTNTHGHPFAPSGGSQNATINPSTEYTLLFPLVVVSVVDLVEILNVTLFAGQTASAVEAFARDWQRLDDIHLLRWSLS
ncbi:hypothetical protein TcWFU_009298 [Taenia crassiceps]|uniref:Uncharacterized protein n=1 Tax=Taenia crassiceps TaxID=6207 RepID=A0ABR4Q9M1_9CEST